MGSGGADIPWDLVGQWASERYGASRRFLALETDYATPTASALSLEKMRAVFAHHFASSTALSFASRCNKTSGRSSTTNNPRCFTLMKPSCTAWSTSRTNGS